METIARPKKTLELKTNGMSIRDSLCKIVVKYNSDNPVDSYGIHELFGIMPKSYNFGRDFPIHSNQLISRLDTNFRVAFQNYKNSNICMDILYSLEFMAKINNQEIPLTKTEEFIFIKDNNKLIDGRIISFDKTKDVSPLKFNSPSIICNRRCTDCNHKLECKCQFDTTAFKQECKNILLEEFFDRSQATKLILPLIESGPYSHKQLAEKLNRSEETVTKQIATFGKQVNSKCHTNLTPKKLMDIICKMLYEQ
jgi:hypothetical protein